MLPDNLVYFFYALLFLGVWVALFIARKDLRRAMLVMSCCIAPLGPASAVWYLQDYWQPVTLTGTAVGIEDVLFGFAIGGIALALYPTIARKRLVKAHAPNLVLLIVFAASFPVCLTIGTTLLKLNSIFSSMAAFCLSAAAMMAVRRDLISPALWSALLSLLLFTAVYQIMQAVYPPLLQAWCRGCNPSGVVIAGVNLEELLWDTTWGLCGGILWEAVTGEVFKDEG